MAVARVLSGKLVQSYVAPQRRRPVLSYGARVFSTGLDFLFAPDPSIQAPRREPRAVQPLDLYPGPPAGVSELFWQAQRFHGFLWASGGVFSDFYVHHVDEVCWMKNAWPVKVEAIGGRHFRGRLDDQNFDRYGVEYTFADDLTAGVAELTDDSPALLQRGADGL